MKKEFCSQCGATTVEYKFRLSKGLVSCLGKLLKADGPAHRRYLHLTNSEYTNFPKLAYWKLSRQLQNADGRTRNQPWTITNMGKFWISGATQVFEQVVTYRGKFVRIEGEPVSISDVDPDWKKADWYVLTRESAGPEVDPKPKQGLLNLAGATNGG